MMESQSSDDEKTLWVGNVDNKATEEVLWELFLQAGPLEYVKIPKDFKTGRQRNYAFIKFLHKGSVPYTIDLMDGICLYGNPLKLCLKSKPSNGNVPEQSERENSPKRRRTNFENEEQFHAGDPHMGQNFCGFPAPGLMGPYPYSMAPHLMTQYPLYAMSGNMALQNHFLSEGSHIEEAPFRKPAWNGNGDDRLSKVRREDMPPIRRSHSSPNRSYDEDRYIDRRRDPYPRPERRRR